MVLIKKLSDKKIKDILETAKKYGINTIDTAQSYGDVEEKLVCIKTNSNI